MRSHMGMSNLQMMKDPAGETHTAGMDESPGMGENLGLSRYTDDKHPFMIRNYPAVISHSEVTRKAASRDDAPCSDEYEAFMIDDKATIHGYDTTCVADYQSIAMAGHQKR